MTDQPAQEPSATEKIIMSSSKLINKLENLELLRNSGADPAPVNMELTDEPRPAYEIFQNLERLILSCDEDDEFFMPAVDDISHLAIVSQSVLSYLKTISPGSRLMTVSSNIYQQCSKWISSLFLSNSLAAFLTTNAECLSKALRLALTSKFENFITEGLPGVKSTSIYINSTNPFLPDLKFAVHLIGLPQSSIKIIDGSGSDSLNFALLTKQIEADKSVDVVPLFLMADLGSSFIGSIDGTVPELSAFAEQHQLWLHLTGSVIASLAIAQNQPEITKNVSSMTLDFESWLGLPNVPTVLLHKQFPALNNGVFAVETDMRKIEAFPLWTVIQNIGKDRIIAAFAQAFHSCRILYEMVNKTRGFRLLSKNPASEGDAKESSKVTVVLFQFDGSNILGSGVGEGDDEAKKAIDKSEHAAYYDRLNSWLGQTLERDFPQVQLALMDHPVFGTCIRYSPFELSIGEKVPSIETFTEFYEFFEAQADILTATIEKKQIFNDLVEKSPVLRLVQLSDDWAGLGGVLYVPEAMERVETDQAKTELNKLNIQLVEKLRSSDNAFSLGESTDGVACIRFGMVTSETDIDELLELVIHAGNALQESSRVLDSLAEVIKKGIMAAEDDLKKEADEKVWNDGILRVVPVVGSVLNWINPLPSGGGSGIRGRSLNLQEGKIESTENIYKYHMQLPLNPQPTGRSSTSHSRNESQSSTNSKTASAPAPSPSQAPAPAATTSPDEATTNTST